MNLSLLFWVLLPALAFQLTLFFVIGAQKKRWKKSNILAKYDISSRSELFSTLQKPDLEEGDRATLQAIYEKSLQER